MVWLALGHVVGFNTILILVPTLNEFGNCKYRNKRYDPLPYKSASLGLVWLIVYSSGFIRYVVPLKLAQKMFLTAQRVNADCATKRYLTQVYQCIVQSSDPSIVAVCAL